MTADEVRDSSSMRTKSFSSPSAFSCSTISLPVAPPTIPVATTGTPSVLSARATLMPLPPGIEVCSTARCRRPSRKFGTERVLSIAALRVTVMIIGPRPLASRPAPGVPLSCGSAVGDGAGPL